MVIAIENLQMTYHLGAETVRVLDLPDWKVGPREQVVLWGPSGTGKSTLLNVLAGLLRPTDGHVRVCGQELTTLSEAQLDRFRAKHISYIFQTFNLLEGYTALENVLMGAAFSPNRLDRPRAGKLLEQVGLGRRTHHRPSALSIGEQQRVAIARALAKSPELILADEPTGSLDPHHAEGVVRLLCDACREHQCALVVVSHETTVAEAFDRRVDFVELNRTLAPTGGAS